MIQVLAFYAAAAKTLCLVFRFVMAALGGVAQPADGRPLDHAHETNMSVSAFWQHSLRIARASAASGDWAAALDAALAGLEFVAAQSSKPKRPSEAAATDITAWFQRFAAGGADVDKVLAFADRLVCAGGGVWAPGVLSSLGQLLQTRGRPVAALRYFDLAAGWEGKDARGSSRQLVLEAKILAASLRTTVPSWHFEMLNDRGRNEAFNLGIQRAVAALRGTSTSILAADCGAGTGLLSLFALRAGAEQVCAIERNLLMVDVGQRVCQAALGEHPGQVQWIAGDVCEILNGATSAARGRPVQLILAEIVDSGLLGEGIARTVPAMSRALCAQSAKIVPSAARVHVALAEAPALARRGRLSKVGQTELALPPAWKLFADEPYTTATVSDGFRFLTDSVPVMNLDFQEFVGSDWRRQEEVTPLLTTAAGNVDGIVMWFDLVLFSGDGTGADTVELKGGLARPGSAWDAVFFFLPEGVQVGLGEALELHVATALDRLEFLLCPDGGGNGVTTQLAEASASEVLWEQLRYLSQPTPSPCSKDLDMINNQSLLDLSQNELVALDTTRVLARVTALEDTVRRCDSALHLLELSAGFSLVGLAALRRLRSAGGAHHLSILTGGRKAASLLGAVANAWGLDNFVEVLTGDPWEVLKGSDAVVLCLSDCFDADCGLLRPGALLDAATVSAILPVHAAVPSAVRIHLRPWDCGGQLQRRAAIVSGQAAGVDVSAANHLSAGVATGLDTRWLQEVGRPLAPVVSSEWLQIGGAEPEGGSTLFGGSTVLETMALDEGDVEAVVFEFEASDVGAEPGSWLQSSRVAAALCCSDVGSRQRVTPGDGISVALHLGAMLPLGRPLLSGVTVC